MAPPRTLAIFLFENMDLRHRLQVVNYTPAHCGLHVYKAHAAQVWGTAIVPTSGHTDGVEPEPRGGLDRAALRLNSGSLQPREMHVDATRPPVDPWFRARRLLRRSIRGARESEARARHGSRAGRPADDHDRCRQLAGGCRRGAGPGPDGPL